MPDATPEQITAFIERWEHSGAAERANYASRRIGSGTSEIILRHVSSRFVSTKSRRGAQVILALRWIGRRAVDDDIIAKLRRNLSPSDRAALPADAACAPAWIADIFHRIAQDSPTA